MLTVAIPKRNKLQNIIVLTPKDGGNRGVPDEAVKGKREERRRESYRKLSFLLFLWGGGWSGLDLHS